MHTNRLMPQTKRRLIDAVQRPRVISLLALPLAVAGALAQYTPPKPIDPGTSAIRGLIVDAQSGEPVANFAVRLSSTRSFATGSTQTNAEGIYEFAGIAAGPYLLSVDSRNYLPTCRQTPEQSSAACPQFALAKDQIRSDLDFRLIRGAVARGRVTDSGGRALRATVRLRVPARDPAYAPVRPGATMPDGTFELIGIPSGRYFVAARSWSDRDVLVASGIVDLVTDSHEIPLTLRRAGRITGKVVTERGGLPPIDGLRVGAAWVHDDVELNPLVPDQVAVSPDGKFRIDGLFGRRAMQLIGLSADWRIRSVRQGRRDVTSGVEVAPARTVDVTIVVGRR